MNMNELQQELNRTKVALMSSKESVFFTTIAFSLKFEWDDTIPTAATNGYKLKWNPTFFLKSTKGQRVFVYVHEACHVAYDHMGRSLNLFLGLDETEKRRRHSIWNKAADHVINLMLKARGFEMWDWVCCDPCFTGMSAEQVYAILLAEDDQSPNQMEDIELPDLGGEGQPASMQEHQKHIENILIRASVQSKMAGEQAGTIPGEIEVFLDNLLRPRLPWTTIVRREVGKLAKSGYTWLKPNRRYFPDLYLPARWATVPAEMTFYVDISGSVSDHQFHVFVSEIAGALRMFNLKKITIVQFDEVIHSVDVVKNLKQLSKIKFSGRGGTDCECIFEHMEANTPGLACVFTDGEFDWYRDKMKSKTRILWLINDNPHFKAQFGRVVHFKT